LSLGLALSGVMLQGLMADGQNGARFSRLLRERAAQRRTLELVRHDLAQANAVSTTPELEQHGCGLAGRSAVLHLHTGAGPITYSVGAAPSAIWRGRVLMRCGPAFALEGELAAGAQAQNRVVLDALAADPPLWQGCADLLGAGVDGAVDVGLSSRLAFSVCLEPESQAVGMRLVQEFSVGSTGQRSRLSTQMPGAG
jgi:hypothetical protein